MADLASRGDELARDFRVLSKRRLKQVPPALPVQRATYTFQASVPEWERVANDASRQRARATTGFRELRLRQEAISAVRDRAEAFTSDAEGSWVPLDHRPEWPDIRQRVLAGVDDFLSQHGVKKPPQEEVEELVQQVGGLGGAQVTARILQPIESLEAHLDELSSAWHACLLGAELATAMASFNLRVRTDPQELQSLNAWLQKTATTLEDYERDIWRALGQGDHSLSAATARELLHWTREDTLARASKMAAILARARLMTVNRWALGPQALATADLLRRLLRGQALAHRTIWFAQGSSAGADAWRDAASRLPFPSRWRPPKSRTLADLWGGAVRSGTAVTVEGVAGPVSNVHVQKKVLSSTWLTDAKGMSIRVGITHIKLDSGGLVEGAYVRVSGEYSRLDQDFHTPLIRVRRRNFGEDSKHSWEDWTTLQIRRFFTAVPHGLTAGWSWERGSIGAANQLRYGSWIPYG